MAETIFKVLMFGGLSLFGVAFILKPTENWKWGQRHFWKLGVLGIVALITGVVGFGFILGGKG